MKDKSFNIQTYTKMEFTILTDFVYKPPSHFTLVKFNGF